MSSVLQVLVFSLFSLTSLNAEISAGPLPTRYAHPDPQQNVANFQYLTAISQKDFHTIGATTYIETFTISSPGTYVLVEDVGYQGRNNVTTDGGACAIFINSSNVVLDFGNKTLYNNSGATLTSVQKGIDVAHYLNNVSVKNGNITGFQDTGLYIRSGCNNIRLQDLSFSNCAKYGISFSGGLNTAITDAFQIANCTIDNVMISNTTGVDNTNRAVGLFLNHCHNILVNNSVFQGASAGTLATAQRSYGALVVSATNVNFSNCDASANYGSFSYGFYLTGSATNVGLNGCSLINCTSNDNQSKQDAGVGGATATGFWLETANTCELNNCIANGNWGSTDSHGFYFDTTQYCQATNCRASNNTSGNTAENNQDWAAGFYSYNGTGNLWEDCIATGQRSTSYNTTQKWAVGFECDTESYSIIRGCQALNNGNNSDKSWGIGINLESCTDCIVDNCKMIGNKSSVTNHGMGLRDSNNAASTTLITNCFFYNNGLNDSTQNFHLNYSGGALSLTTTVNQTTVGSINATLQPYTNVTMGTTA
jgi:hypothetical protein